MRARSSLSLSPSSLPTPAVITIAIAATSSHPAGTHYTTRRIQYSEQRGPKPVANNPPPTSTHHHPRAQYTQTNTHSSNRNNVPHHHAPQRPLRPASRRQVRRAPSSLELPRRPPLPPRPRPFVEDLLAPAGGFQAQCVAEQSRV
jgi:hypothetical protein